MPPVSTPPCASRDAGAFSLHLGTIGILHIGNLYSTQELVMRRAARAATVMDTRLVLGH